MNIAKPVLAIVRCDDDEAGVGVELLGHGSVVEVHGSLLVGEHGVWPVVLLVGGAWSLVPGELESFMLKLCLAEKGFAKLLVIVVVVGRCSCVWRLRPLPVQGGCPELAWRWCGAPRHRSAGRQPSLARAALDRGRRCGVRGA